MHAACVSLQHTTFTTSPLHVYGLRALSRPVTSQRMWPFLAGCCVQVAARAQAFWGQRKTQESKLASLCTGSTRAGDEPDALRWLAPRLPIYSTPGRRGLFDA